ncbi:MAG TPA: thiamine pyrophosphate-binding protein [Candidatus Limnocylindrales bacterium]
MGPVSGAFDGTRRQDAVRPILMKGNEAMAEAAIQAGCDAYFGYPITPQAELLEWMARRMPELGRVFVQAESELGAINMALGAAATGARVLVSSSSPGISLMAEGMSYLAGSEVPIVVIDVMRGGPGLGSIGPSQSDYFQATKGHGHGDYRVPVLAPSSIAEAVELTADAFEIAEREVRWAGEHLEGAEIVIVAYGTSARVARTAIERARDQGLRAGLFRPISLWPFPATALSSIVRDLRAVLVVEMSAGQMVEDVRLVFEGRAPVFFHGRTGGMVPTPGDVVEALGRACALTEELRRASPADGLAAGDEPDPLSLIEDGAWATAERPIPTTSRAR